MDACCESQNEFKVWETGDDRSNKANFRSILVSCDGPAPLAMLACVKGTDTLARLTQVGCGVMKWPHGHLLFPPISYYLFPSNVWVEVFHVKHRFQASDVMWNLAFRWKIPTLANAPIAAYLSGRSFHVSTILYRNIHIL